MVEEFEAWLERAMADLKAAKYLLDGNFFEESAFHSQQAAEKALKAVYLKKFGEVVKTHELVNLGKKVGLDKSLLEECEGLTGIFLASRYPGLEEKLEELDAENSVATAAKVLEWAKKLLT